MADILDRLEAALAERYRIERELGSGGMATVYLAEDLKHHRQVAIKVLRPDLAAVLGSYRFLREIEIAAKLTHPHILPLHDSGEADGFLYYVMPYVAGESLRDRLNREKQLPIDDSLKLASEVADALGFAHEHNVIHRDIKPENILLEGKHAVVADFGIARAIEEAGETRLTETGITIGTPAYMSPEQASGETEIDGRSDVYALGCVLFEMLGGEPPYVGTTPQAILAKKLAEPVPSVRVLRGTVTEGVERVVRKSLAKDQVDRFATAADFATALAAPEAVATPADTRAVLAARGKKMAGMVAAVAVALLVVVVGPRVVLREGGTVLDPEHVVVVPLENRTGAESVDEVGRVAADRMAQGLMQTGLLQVVPPTTALQAGRDYAAQEETTDRQSYMLSWAHEIGAGTLVHGGYTLRGDSLTLQVHVSEVRSGNLILSLDPVSASAADPMNGIDVLMQRLMGALASIFDPGFPATSVGAALATRTPIWDAYRAYTAGLALYDQADFPGAAEYLSVAYERDSSFVYAIVLAAVAHMNLQQLAIADSLTRIAARARDQLAPLDRTAVDWLVAFFAGDNSGMLSASREAVGLAPSSGGHFQAGMDATVANRPREALNLLRTYDLERRPWMDPWFVLARAHHMLGDHRRELSVARRAQEQFPDNMFVRSLEISALLALDRVGEASNRIDDALNLPPVRGWGFSAKSLLQAAALEGRAHGHRELASQLLDRALTWLADRPGEETLNRSHRYDVAATDYLAEHWQEATLRFRALAEESPGDTDVEGHLGVLAARRGDTEEAERVSEWLRDLDAPYLFGRHTYWRARIAAQLGELGDAVRLLRAALAEGLRFSGEHGNIYVNAPYLALHAEMDLEPLRDYEPFQELMRPKG